MNTQSDAFREKLLNAEHIDPGRKIKHQEEIQTMIEQKISAPLKAGIIMIAVMNVGFAVMTASWAVIFTQWFPIVRFTSCMFAVFFAAVSFYCVLVVKKGKINLMKQPVFFVSSFYLFSIVLMILLMIVYFHLETLEGIAILISGLFVVISSTAALIITIVRQSEIKTREKLMEIEYRIADFAEKIS